MAAGDRGAAARAARGVAGSRPPEPRGFALLIVLGALGLVALIFATLTAAGRGDVREAAGLRDAARAAAAADGGIDAAVFSLLRGAAAVGEMRIGDAVVRVRAESDAGRVNPNVAGTPLLRALLVEMGVDPSRAEALAAAIVDWRTPGQGVSPHGAKATAYRAAGRDYGPPGAPFRDLGELRLVLGMTDDVARALVPHLTLWWGTEPDFGLADPVVRRAVMDVANGVRPPPAATGERVFSIVATAVLPGGATATRRAEVRFEPYADGRDFRVLERE